MPPSQPGVFARIALAFGTFFRIVGDSAYASSVQQMVFPPLVTPQPAPEPVVPSVPAFKPVAPSFVELSPAAALQLLSLLQRDARLIDFSEEDLTGYEDADIGAAARVVHEGCRKVLREHFTIVPVRSEAEGTRITLPQGFDAASTRLTGNVTGVAPFTGTLNHRGWRVDNTRLPQLAQAHDATILAPAEVDL
ncbi:MAG: DUF2760 domain-containing protein [Janthinobacterium lividum]